MDMNFMMKMLGQSLEKNPSLQQLLTLKTMLDKLPREKQSELIGNFIKELEEAVKEVEK